MSVTSDVVLSFTVAEAIVVASCIWALTWVLIKHSVMAEKRLLEQKFETLTTSINALTESLERLQGLYHQLDKDLSVKTSAICKKD